MKFFVGDEYTGLLSDRIEWVIYTFDRSRYRFVDEGYFTFERYVVFDCEEDAMLFRIRWS